MPRYLFVTGKLAAQSLQDTVAGLVPRIDYEIAILPISVAALMNTSFVSKHLPAAQGCDAVILPGLCQGDLVPLMDKLGIEVTRGPRHLKDLSTCFGKEKSLKGYGSYKTKILAEIADAYMLSLEKILARAKYYRESGADIIDLGCPVEGSFPDIERVVRALKADSFIVSVDSYNPEDILSADQAGADYVLSVNAGNLDLARQLHCKMVVIPDFDQGLESLERNIAQMEAWSLPYIIDPILRPISFGFAESLEGFISMRRKYPQAQMLMGLGNLTELTDADTTGITAVMAGFLTELRIDYVLTTEVVSWARGAVRELDLARRLMHYSCENRILPKHLNDELITVKDPTFEFYRENELRAMQAKVQDPNFRIFTDREHIFVFNNRIFAKGTDIQSLFSQLGVLEASEAFYLGKELQKARLAIRLGKKYTQEEELRWGYMAH